MTKPNQKKNNQLDSSSPQQLLIKKKTKLQLIQNFCSNTHRVKMLINTETKFYSIAKTGARWYFIQLWDFKLFSYILNIINTFISIHLATHNRRIPQSLPFHFSLHFMSLCWTSNVLDLHETIIACIFHQSYNHSGKTAFNYSLRIRNVKRMTTENVGMSVSVWIQSQTRTSYTIQCILQFTLFTQPPQAHKHTHIFLVFHFHLSSLFTSAHLPVNWT